MCRVYLSFGPKNRIPASHPDKNSFSLEEQKRRTRTTSSRAMTPTKRDSLKARREAHRDNLPRFDTCSRLLLVVGLLPDSVPAAEGAHRPGCCCRRRVALLLSKRGPGGLPCAGRIYEERRVVLSMSAGAELMEALRPAEPFFSSCPTTSAERWPDSGESGNGAARKALGRRRDGGGGWKAVRI